MAIDLTDKNYIKFDIRASRTGSHIKIGVHDAGGTTTETTPNVVSADVWQEVVWDISGVANANKDAIDSIIITILNADAANTFYVDNMYATVYKFAKLFEDDTTTLSEPVFSNAASRILSDTATLSEVAQRDVTFILSEIATLSDLISKAGARAFADTATLSEISLKAVTLQRFVDTVTLSDAITKGRFKTFTDIYTLLDNVIKWHRPTDATTVWTEVGEESSVWTEEEAEGAWVES